MAQPLRLRERLSQRPRPLEGRPPVHPRRGIHRLFSPCARKARAANPERIRGGTILGDAGIPVNKDSTPGPFGPLFVFLVTTSRGA